MLLLFTACTSGPVSTDRTPTQVETTLVVPGPTSLPGDTGPDWTWCDGAPDVVLNELVAANHHGLTDADGDTSDWVELAVGADGVDVSGWLLADGHGNAWTFPSLTLNPSETRLVFLDGKDRADAAELHTSFNIAAEGEDLFLEMPDGCVVDHVAPTRLYEDVSVGRCDGSWQFFLEPTPGAENTTECRPGFADPPEVSPDAGFYADPVTVTVTGEGTTRCTTDGSPPGEDDAACTEVPLDAAAQLVPLRARAFIDGLWPSRITTATYSQDPSILDGGVLVIALTVDPPDLWDEETGIYVYGDGAEPSYPYFGANFWQLWEKDVHVELFDETGARELDQDAGIQIAGGYSRAFDQRNFELLARSGYGPDTFGYAVFPEETIDAYHKLYLRNGGDWCSTQIVDGSVQEMFRDPDGTRNAAVDAQAYTPGLVYLNGEFWGVYEVKERLDEWWIHDHRGEGPDDLDRVKLGWTHDANWDLEEGTWDAWNTLNALTTTQDLADPAAYTDFTTQVDETNFAALLVVEEFAENTDFWWNNLRMWRPTDGEWRWMAYDFGHGWSSYAYDHLAMSLTQNSDGMPIGNALGNAEFRALFANVHADFFNTSLAPDSATATVARLADDVRPVMAKQRERWCGGANMGAWEDAITYAEEYASKRGPMMDKQLMEHLGLSGHAQLSLDAEPETGGTFRLTVIEVEPPFTGLYYQDVPVTVTAVPAEGYAFDGWTEASWGTEPTVTVPMSVATSLTARFRSSGQ